MVHETYLFYLNTISSWNIALAGAPEHLFRGAVNNGAPS